MLTSVFDRLSLDLLHVLRQELVPEATTEDLAELLGSGLYALGHADGWPGDPDARSPGAGPPGRGVDGARHHAAQPGAGPVHLLGSGRRGRLSAAAGRPDGEDAIAAEATAAGVAWGRTLELLGLPRPR